MIEVFKILKGFENVDLGRFFQVVKDDGKEGMPSSCLEEGTGWKLGGSRFANRVCDEWNRLDEVVAVGSVNAFKRKLDHHLRNVRGYF